jgi:hypothetical protein
MEFSKLGFFAFAYGFLAFYKMKFDNNKAKSQWQNSKLTS